MEDKKINLKLPQWLAIIGQSGAGKSTVTQILLEWCAKLKIPTLHIQTGELIRICSEKNTYVSNKIKELNNKGNLSPHFVAASLIFNEILEKYKEEQILILEGSPRYVEQFILMNELVQKGFFKELKVLEVITRDDVCIERLKARTRSDKRLDLSIDGQPGTPDDKKISTKMEWWQGSRHEIFNHCLTSGVYLNVNNNEDIIRLKNNLSDLFAV